MLPDYNDIKKRINQDPIWYDGGGVPRYDPFRPDMLGVYDRVVLFVEIACQACTKTFYVGVGWDPWVLMGNASIEDIASSFHYGDPPIHGCMGDTMNCVDKRIVGAWERSKEKVWQWERNFEIEKIDVMQEWAREALDESVDRSVDIADPVDPDFSGSAQ